MASPSPPGSEAPSPYTTNSPVASANLLQQQHTIKQLFVEFPAGYQSQVLRGSEGEAANAQLLPSPTAGLMRASSVYGTEEQLAAQLLDELSPAKEEGPAEPPTGVELEIRILSTWGDPHYVGLTGVEVYDTAGDPVVFSSSAQLRADPPDVNCLDGHSGDPRTVDKLIDGVNTTCDDTHMWLTPYEPTLPNKLWLKLGSRRELALVRVFNYNKSRIHAFRGARNVQMLVDGQLVWSGELHRAPGMIAGVEDSVTMVTFMLL